MDELSQHRRAAMLTRSSETQQGLDADSCSKIIPFIRNRAIPHQTQL